MNAYLFAIQASPAAVAALLGQVSPEGPVRVGCPLIGDRALYVALTESDEEGLTHVSRTQGVTDPSVYVVVPGIGSVGVNPAAYPTYCAVEAWVGFAMLTVPEGFAGPPLNVPGVVGVAIVRGPDGDGILVEVTAGNESDTRARLAGLEGYDGTQISFSAVGRVADGAGFRQE